MGVEKIIYHGLTHPQKRIWYINKINPDSPLHNIGGCINIVGSINVEIMKKAFNILAEKNIGLQLRFMEIDANPFQYVSEFTEQNVDFIDFSEFNDPWAEHEKWSSDTFKKKFNIYDIQLFYFAIYKISPNHYGVLLNIHHIISDGWTIVFLEKQLCEIYESLLNGREPFLEENHSYIDYIEYESNYLKSEKFMKHKDFWNQKFSDIPYEFLYNSTKSLEGNRLSIELPADLNEKINEFINSKKCSLNTFFIAILAIYMHKTMNKNDLVIGNPVYNRVNRKQKNTSGMFTSTVPLRFLLDPGVNFDSLIKQVMSEIKHCFLNQSYPYDLLIKDLELSKLGYDNLFKICVNYYNTQHIEHVDNMPVSVTESYCGSQSYSLQLTVKEEKKGKIILVFDYKSLEYTEQEIKAIQKAVIYIAHQVMTHKELLIDKLKLISDKEINYKLHEFNATNSCYPQKTVYELFEAKALKLPNNIALEFEDKTLTYKELNEKSNQISNLLLEKGIKRGSVVAVMETHSPGLVASILGVIKAGGTYLPIEPNYPVERINYMLKDSNSKILLTDFEPSGNLELNGETVNLINIDLNMYDKENPKVLTTMYDLAYIIYTSGSTGRPKGVMITHQGLTNYIWWAGKTYFKDIDEAMALYSSISFDLTVTSIFSPLILGNKIVIYDNDEAEFVLYKILRENKVSVVKLTPAHLALIKEMNNRNSRIKRLIVGGDDFKVSLAKEVSDSFGYVEIFNEYGPTETVVGCMIYKYDKIRDKGLSVPIGRSADNVQIYILDINFNIVPTGLIGELYISGDGVAKGYLNNEELTNERFLENPFVPGKRMYKTGDLARYLEGGDVEYVGRSDSQVKIRGHRIELREIERHLIEFESIKDAIVLIKKGASGSEVLNAYIVSKVKISEKELKDALLCSLPKYMIPTHFIFMDELPLTANGKVSHELLPEPVTVKNEFAGCKTQAEKELVNIMKEVLMIENISLNDNYYQLGGDSIKAIQISSKLRNAGFSINVKDILTYEIIGEMASHLTEADGFDMPDQGLAIGEFSPTPIIKWFFEQNFAERNHYNQSVLLKSGIPLVIDEINDVLFKLIEHHDTLRVNYNQSTGMLYYNNEHLKNPLHIEAHDLSAYTDYEQDAKIKELGLKIKSSFDIEHSILLKACVFDLGKRGQFLLLTAHHLIIDGISWRILIEDFINNLELRRSGQEFNLPHKTHSFMRWSELLHEYSQNKFDAEEQYWASLISEEFQFQINSNSGPKESVQMAVSTTLDTICEASALTIDISKETTQKLLTSTNDVYGTELHETLIIALASVIKDVTKHEGIIIELESHGRSDVLSGIDISSTIGWFTGINPIKLMLKNDDLDFNMKSLKEQIRAVPNKGFNFGVINHLKGKFQKNNNLYIRFNFLGDFDNLFNNNIFEFSRIDCGSDIGLSNYMTSLIDINSMIINKKLKISITYGKNNFTKETMQSFLNGYIEKLDKIIELCSEEFDKKLTPSDFTASDISQEDLDSLFG